MTRQQAKHISSDDELNHVIIADWHKKEFDKRINKIYDDFEAEEETYKERFYCLLIKYRELAKGINTKENDGQKET